MAKVEDLKAVLKETLENRGVLSQVRARIRAEVFNALDEQAEVKPTLSNENLLINELIREYLDFNKYKYTNSVLTVESGQPKDPIERRFLAKELHIEDIHDSGKVPLLYGIVSHFLQGNNVRPANRPSQNPRMTTAHCNSSNADDSSLQQDDMQAKRDRFISYEN